MSKTVETLTAQEADSMLEAMLPQFGSKWQVLLGVRNRCITLLMLDAGLRVGETVQLLKSDLIIEAEPIVALRVRKEIAKGKRERLVPITERLKIAIVEMQRHWWKKFSEPIFRHAFFTDSPGQHITTRQVERIIAKYSRSAFGREIHPHILRHTFATRLMATTSMRIVQALLGHKNIATTQIYTHPNDMDLKTAIESIEKGD